jgi:hypothetical protein
VGGSGFDLTGAPGEVRTHDLQLRRLSLYPSELRARCAFRKKAVETPSREICGVLDYFNACAACAPQGFRGCRPGVDRPSGAPFK